MEPAVTDKRAMESCLPREQKLLRCLQKLPPPVRLQVLMKALYNHLLVKQAPQTGLNSSGTKTFFRIPYGKPSWHLCAKPSHNKTLE